MNDARLKSRPTSAVGALWRGGAVECPQSTRHAEVGKFVDTATARYVNLNYALNDPVEG
jgi:hypothetical protein